MLSVSLPPHMEREERQGATSLMYACQQGDEKEVINIIQTKPGLVAERERTLKTALHYCAESGSAGVGCAAAVLSAAPRLVSVPDHDGYSPLHLAVIAGNLPLIDLLVSKGAEVNAVDNERHTSVHWATVCGEIESLEAILRYGGNPSLADMHGGCPVHYAAQMCGPGSEMPADTRLGLAALKILLARGADPNPRDNHGRQPLLWAASAGSSDAILALVNAGANVEASDNDGLTALHCAASRGHTDCVETLISFCGAGVDVIDTNGCSALFYSVTLGHADVTQLLLNHGANTNHQDRKGRTAVHCGAAKGQLETLRVVAGFGGNTWQRTVRGDYPLHDAVASGRRSLVTWLLGQRPDAVNAPNNDGRCPLHVAAIHNNVEMCKTLLDGGSLVNPVMRTSKGDLATPLDAALHKGYRGCAKYLQLHGGVPANRLNGHFAALRGPKNRQVASGVEQSDTRQTEGNKESTVADHGGGLSVSRHNDILMTTPKAKILQVFVEDEVEIRRIRYTDNAGNHVKHRYRKRKNKHVSEKDYEKHWDYKKRLEISTDEDSHSNSDTSVQTDKSCKVKKWSRGHKMKSERDIKTKYKETKHESKEVNTEKDGIGHAEHENKFFHEKDNSDISSSNEYESQKLKSAIVNGDITRLPEMCNEDKIIGVSQEICESRQDELYVDNDSKSINSEIASDIKESNTQIVTAIVHKDPDSNDDITISQEEECSLLHSDSALQETPQKSIEPCHGEEPVEKNDDPVQNSSEKQLTEESVELYPEVGDDQPVTEPEPKLDLTVMAHDEDGNLSENNTSVESAVNEENNHLLTGNEKSDLAPDISSACNENVPEENADDEEGKAVSDEKNKEASEKETLRVSVEQPTDIKNQEDTSLCDTTESNMEEILTEQNVTSTIEERNQTQDNEKTVDENENSEQLEDSGIQGDVIESTEKEGKEDESEISKYKSAENEKERDYSETLDESVVQYEGICKSLESEIDDSERLHGVTNDLEDPLDDNLKHDLEDKATLVPLNENKGLIKVFGAAIQAKNALHVTLVGRSSQNKNTDEIVIRDKSPESSENLEIESVEIDKTVSTNGAQSISLLSTEITSPHREKSIVRRSQRNDPSRIPRPCRKGGYRNDYGRNRTELATVSVTQAVQLSMRKYHLERRIFHHLLELKRLQIRAGRASEAVLVKRLVDDYIKAPFMLGLQQYSGAYTFASFEKYLYEQLRLLQTSGNRVLSQIKSSDDLDRLVAALKKTKAGQDLLTSVPSNAVLCTLGSHKCHHATHAYTGVPCAAYISKQNHHTMPKSASNMRFLPKIVNDENHAEVARTLRYVDPSRPLTLELNHGSDKQIISLPTEKLDKNKRYFVTFTIRGGEQLYSERKHTHASSL